MTPAPNGRSHTETWPLAKEGNMTQQLIFALHCVTYLPLQGHMREMGQRGGQNCVLALSRTP